LNLSPKENKAAKNRHEENPPVFKSWFGWYSSVIIILLIELILFYIIAKVF
jgi:hypothetical protein